MHVGLYRSMLLHYPSTKGNQDPFVAFTGVSTMPSCQNPGWVRAKSFNAADKKEINEMLQGTSRLRTRQSHFISSTGSAKSTRTSDAPPSRTARSAPGSGGGTPAA